MTEKRQQELLAELKTAIESVTDYGADSHICDPGHVLSGSNASLAMEGLYEWAPAVTGRASIYAGVSGNYSQPLEPAIAAVLDKIESEGGYLEAETSWAVSIYEA